MHERMQLQAKPLPRRCDGAPQTQTSPAALVLSGHEARVSNGELTSRKWHPSGWKNKL